MPGQNMMTPETLLPRIGAPDAPIMIDVCIDEDFALDPRLIPGAFRHPFADIEALAPALEGQDVVVICQKGLKLSQGAAAILRAHRVDAKALIGGMIQWAALGYPAIPAAAAPAARIVAAEDPSPDALAALWLIKRFVRRDAQILFVAADAMDPVADRFDATLLRPFADQQNHFGLTQPSLTRLAQVLAGDAGEASGAKAALAGLRALHPDDLSYSVASLQLFDALHRAFHDASDTTMQTGAAA